MTTSDAQADAIVIGAAVIGAAIGLGRAHPWPVPGGVRV